MGKQVKGWVPPQEELIEQEPAAKPAAQWTPPSDEMVVKKKDDAVVNSEDGTTPPQSQGSSTPAEQPETPSENPTARSKYESRVENLRKTYQGNFDSKISEFAGKEQQEYERLMEAKATELQGAADGQAQLDAYSKQLQDAANKRISDYQAKTANELAVTEGPNLNKWANLYASEYEKERFAEDKVRNPVKSLAKTAWNTARYQLPSDLVAGFSAMIEDAPHEAIGKPFNTMVTELVRKYPWLEPGFGKLEDLEKATGQSDAQDERRKAAFRAATGLKLGGDEASKNLVNSLDKAEDFIDYINWAGSAFGQAAGQIPAAILTRGGSAIGQEVGTIYMDGINRIASEKGITPSEVIEKGLDESLYPVLFGTAAGALETVGAKGVGKGLVDSFSKKEVMQSLRDRGWALIKAGVTESGTEGAQSVLEQIGGAKAGGKTFMEALKEVKSDDIIESMAQGFIGGTGLHATGQLIKKFKNKPLKQVIAEQKKTIDTSNLESAKQAAETIKQAVVAETKPEAPVIEPIKSETIAPISETIQEPASAIPEVVAQPVVEPQPEIQEETKPTENETQPELSQSADETTVQQQPQGTEQPPPPETGVSDTEGDLGNQPLSGIKKALVPEEKAHQVEVDRRKDKEVLEQAKAAVDSGKVNPTSIIENVLETSRPLTGDEVGALVYHKARLDNQMRDALQRLADGDDTAQPELDALSKQMDQYHEMSVKTAASMSEAFRLRKMLLDSEYNLQSQINQYKAVNNGEIPQEILEKYQQLDADLKAANQKIELLQAQQEKLEGNAMLGQMAEQDTRRMRKAMTAERKQKIATFFDGLKADTSNKGMLSASVIPGITMLPHVWNGSVEVVKQAVLTGVDVAAAIQSGIDYIKANHQGEFDEEKYRAGMTPLLLKATREQEPPKPTVTEGKVVVPQALVRDLVASGVKDINELTDQVHAMLGDESISKREVRDAITKYGKTATMSQKELDVKIRQLKRTGILISQLEDAQKGKRPKRSGLQRDKPSDEERRLKQQIDNEMKNLPPTAEEEAQVWKNALDRVKTRLQNQIVDLENQLSTGERRAKKQGIQYDQEALDLQAKRDALKELVGNEQEGQTDEQRIRNAIKATQKSVEDIERRIKEKDFSKKQQRQTPVTPELAKLRAERDAARKELDQLKEQEGIAEQERLAIRKKSVQRAIDDYQRRIKEKDFGPRKKPEPAKQDDELRDALRERERIKEEFDTEKERARLENRSFTEKAKDLAFDAANIPKSLLSSLDLSAVLRQGGVLLPSHPVAWAKSFVEMFRMAASEKYYNNWLRDLKASDMYPLIQQAKLFISDTNAKMTVHEEQFMSKLARKIPIIGQSIQLGKNFKIPGLDLIGASSRAYSGFLNSLRTQVFSAGIDKFQQEGYTPEKNPEQYKALADFINNATGRGKLAGQKLENAAPVLNALFFSPRFMASRLNMLNPVYYAKLPAPVRKEALKSVISYIAFVSAIGAIGAAADWWEIELDPRSTDFGKFRIGDTRFDPWGGFQSYVRVIAQLLTGQKKSINGELQDLNSGKFGSDTRADIIERFFRGKLAPTPSAAWNLLEGKNVVGEEATLESEALRMVIPLYMQDMSDMYSEKGGSEVVKTFLPALFGIGVQNYTPQIKAKPTMYDRINKRIENAKDVNKKIERKQKEIEKVY